MTQTPTASSVLTREQHDALALLADPGDDADDMTFEMLPGGGTVLHRDLSTRLGKLGRKDLLSSPPMRGLREVRDGRASALRPADLRAVEAFAAAFAGNTGLLLLGARFAANSMARHRALQDAAAR